jgi:hypothetical protein
MKSTVLFFHRQQTTTEDNRSDFGIDLHWIREDNYNDSLERDTDITTDQVIEMLWNGEDAKAMLKQRIQELAEKQFDTWKHSSKLAYKACK